MKKIGLLFVTIIMMMLFAVSASAVYEDTIKVQSVSLKSEYEIYEGDLINLNPTFSPANATDKTYTLTGADTGSYKFSDYLTISSGGYITAKKATTNSSGNAFYFTITIKTNDGNKTATTKIKVLPRMIYLEYHGIESSPWCYGNSAKLSVAFNDEIENQYLLSDVIFKSDNTTVATVDNFGVVTCTGIGDVTISAYTSDNKYSCDYRIYVRKSIKVAKAFFGSCQVGKTYKISAEIIPSAGTDSLRYYSSDNSIATVDNAGVVTFKAPGSVMISVHNSTDPFNPKQVWFSSNSFTLPSGTNAELLNSMRTSANAVKSLKNLPAINRYDETITSDFSTSTNKLSPSDLQNIFNSELAPRNKYYSSIVYDDSNYTTLKTNFMNNVPVSGQIFVISPNLLESDIKSITVSNSTDNHYYEIQLTLKEEYMSTPPSDNTSTNHGKVFDILTDSYINTFLDKINSSGSMSITYSSFTQNYHDSTLTLRINKATGNIERAVYDMNLDVNVSKLKMKYSILLQYTMDVAFKCNNIVIIDFNDYYSSHRHSFTNYISDGKATCTTIGFKTAKCDNCEVSNTIPEKGEHSFSENWTIDINPTCVSNGYKSQHCTICNERTNITILDTIDHSFTNYISDSTATCVTDGKLIAKCDNCEATDVKPEKGAHKFDVFLFSKYPSCTEDGEMAYFCKWCELKDESSVVKLEKLPHNFKNDWQAITLPTCTNAGVSIRICNNCLITESKIENAKGHSFNGSACTDCGYNRANDCSCNCHKGGISGFFFKILNFFQKLFGTNKICACGAKH